MQIFTEIPTSSMDTPVLDEINTPDDLKQLSLSELLSLCDQLRAFALRTVNKTGGHFGSWLGVVELTIALHYVFNTPEDKLIWDVGHQSYPHKILTGRKSLMHTLRQIGGLSGFPNIFESKYDAFGVGHSSTSISAALGMAIASQLNGGNNKHVAIIGDGAITAGIAFEALNHAIETSVNILVILNDNEMSISHNTGGLSRYLSQLLSHPSYSHLRQSTKKVLAHMPRAFKFVQKTEEYTKSLILENSFFESLGWNYIGPIDGHNLEHLIEILQNIKDLSGPQFLHIVTTKGKGFADAEASPIKMHAITKIENNKLQSTNNSNNYIYKYSDIFGLWASNIALNDAKFTVITPAMSEGSGLVEFSQKFPKQFFDVAIAEQHAVTIAAGMSLGGLKPVVAIYSTFLQRAYDQLIHDVALQNLPVIFAIDRAGIVGEDGATHAGIFDIAFLLPIPNLVVASPSDGDELVLILNSCYKQQILSAVRYPRGTSALHTNIADNQIIEIGKALVVKRGTSKMCVLVFGFLLQEVLKIDELDLTIIDMRFIKPLDGQLLLELAKEHLYIVTVEDSVVIGGAGAYASMFLQQHNVYIPILNLGLPDEFIEHGTQEQLYQHYRLDARGIQNSIEQFVISNVNYLK